MSRRPFQLSPAFRFLVYGLTAALFVTGFLLWYSSEALEDTGQAIPWIAAAEVNLRRIHGAAALAFSVLFGVMLGLHAWRAWRAGQNRWTGGVLVLWLAVELMTSYGLQYLPEGDPQAWARVVHVSGGLLLPAVLLGHVGWGWWSARRRESAPAAAA